MNKQAKTTSRKKQPLLKRSIDTILRLLPVFAVVLFLAYRGVLLVQSIGDNPLVGISQREFLQYTCGNREQTEDAHSTDRNVFPLLSNDYMSRLRGAYQQAQNLLENSNLATIDPTTNDPSGFSRNDPIAGSTYSIVNEDGAFLRINQQTPGQQELAASWLPKEVSIEPAATYAISFEYRTTAAAQVVIEFITAAGERTYTGVSEIQPSTSWQHFSVHFDNIIQDATQIRYSVSLIDAGTLDTRSYGIFKIPSAQLDTGVVSVTFDDGWKSIYEKAFPLLTQYNIPTTQYIVAEFSANQFEGYMSMGDIKKMAQAGHEIASHSVRHCDQVALNTIDLAYDAKIGKHTLTDEGFDVTGFAHPFGSYTAQTIQALEEHYSLLRSSDVGFNDRYFDPLNIRTQTVHDTTTLEELKSWLQYAHDNNVWLVLIYHRVDESGSYNLTYETLQEQLQLIHDSGLPTMTVKDAATRITN